MTRDDLGTIYLIHLTTPLGKADPDRKVRGRKPRTKPYEPHARHYLGWASDLEARIEQHRQGYRNGHDGSSRFMLAVKAEGIEWEVVRTWENQTVIREFQRSLKR